MASYEIKTEINIQSTPARIWNILTDFEKYPTWNPFIKSISGNMKVNNQIHINAGGMKFSPILLAYDHNKNLKWRGKLFVKGLFDGEHNFIIHDNQDGSVTFRHEESFSGILVSLFKGKLYKETKPGFEAMNEKLKELAEQNS